MILYIAEQIRLIGGKYAEEIFFRRARKFRFPHMPCQNVDVDIENFHQGQVSETTREYVRHLQAKERQDE